MRTIALLFCIIFSLVQSKAQDSTPRVEQGNEAYETGDYSSAIEYYLIADSLNSSAGLHYNLANAYYKNGNLGKAILYYERAFKLMPSNEDISHNLKLAKTQTLDKLEDNKDDAFSSWWNAVLLKSGMNRLAWLSIIAAVVSALGWFLFRISSSRNRKQMGFGIGFAGALFAIVLLIMSVSARNIVLDNQQAIILKQRVKVTSAPDESSTELFILHEGSKVTLKEERGIWSNIALPNGNIGWMPSTDLEAI